MPFKSIELTSAWDLGGDGKCFIKIALLNHEGQVHRPERVNQGTCPYDPEVSFSKFIGLFATHNYFENDKPAVLSKLFFEDSKKYNTDILKGMEHSPTELKAFNDICEMAECYLPKA